MVRFSTLAQGKVASPATAGQARVAELGAEGVFTPSGVTVAAASRMEGVCGSGVSV